MKPRTLGALVGAVVLVAGFVWFFERDVPSTTRAEELARRVVTFAPSDVTRLEIEGPSGAVELTRAEDGWRLGEPFGSPADERAVDDLLDDLTVLESTRELDEWNPSAVGLDPPRARLRLATAPGLEVALDIGAEVPGTSTMIVAVAGTDLARVVEAAIWGALAREPGAWRSRAVFATPRDEVYSMTLRTTGGAVRIEQRADEPWIVEPIEDHADPALARGLFDTVGFAEIQDFLDGSTVDPAPWGGSEIEVLSADGARELLSLAEPEPEGGRIATLGGRRFRLGSVFDEALARDVDDWRSRAWLRLPVYDIEGFRVRSDALAPIELSRVDGEWRSAAASIESGLVNDFLYALDEATAEGFTATRPATAPRLIVDLRAGPTNGDVTLELHGIDASGSLPAVASGRPGALLLPASAGERIDVALEALRE